MIIPIQFGSCIGNSAANGGTNYIVRANNGSIYQIYVDSLSDVVYKKSSDNGLTWSSPVVVFAGTTWQLAVWYGRWSDRADDKIYLAYSETVTDDILFRTIDTGSSDALGTQTTVFAGASTANGGMLSITIAKGGNIVVAGYIDAGAEGGTFKSTDAGATWGGTIANVMEATSADQIYLCPGFNADTQDIMAIFWDATADELSVKRYDDSANTWTETSIATSMVDATPQTSFPHAAIAVDIANSRIVLVAWSAVDAANQDLRCWTIQDASITAKTDVVTNATDDCHLAGLSIDTTNGVWYAFWCGNTDGSETVYTALNVWYKTSTDAGSTWSAATKITSRTYPIKTMWSCPLISEPPTQFLPVSIVTLETGTEVQYIGFRNIYLQTGGRITIS